jgi:hypothetical protein
MSRFRPDFYYKGYQGITDFLPLEEEVQKQLSNDILNPFLNLANP